MSESPREDGIKLSELHTIIEIFIQNGVSNFVYDFKEIISLLTGDNHIQIYYWGEYISSFPSPVFQSCRLRFHS